MGWYCVLWCDTMFNCYRVLLHCYAALIIIRFVNGSAVTWNLWQNHWNRYVREHYSIVMAWSMIMREKSLEVAQSTEICTAESGERERKAVLLQAPGTFIVVFITMMVELAIRICEILKFPIPYLNRGVWSGRDSFHFIPLLQDEMNQDMRVSIVWLWHIVKFHSGNLQRRVEWRSCHEMKRIIQLSPSPTVNLNSGSNHITLYWFPPLLVSSIRMACLTLSLTNKEAQRNIMLLLHCTFTNCVSFRLRLPRLKTFFKSLEARNGVLL